MNSTTYNLQPAPSKAINLLLFLTLGYLAVAPLNNLPLMYIFRIPALVCIVYLIVLYYSRSKKKFAVCIITLFLISIINIFLTDVEIGVDLILSLFSIFTYLYLIIISPEIRINANLKGHLYCMSIIGTVILTFHNYAPYSHVGVSGDYVFDCIYLTLGMGNSNYAGIIAFLIYSLLLITTPHKRKYRILTMVAATWLLYLIFETNCRSAFASAILIPITSYFFKIFKLRNIIILLVCSIPFFFVPLYINFAKDSDQNQTEIMGKEVLSGRDKVYSAYLDRVGDNWLIGTFNGTPFHNAHNGPLSIFSSVGVIGLICFFGILIYQLIRANNKARTNMAKYGILVILACFIESCGEGSLFLGGFPCITFFFLFYVLAFSTYNDAN